MDKYFILKMMTSRVHKLAKTNKENKNELGSESKDSKEKVSKKNIVVNVEKTLPTSIPKIDDETLISFLSFI
jgi:hypothetical protein